MHVIVGRKVGLALSLMLAITAACARNRVPRSPAFHEQVLDPAGDAIAVQGVAQPPDLVSGIVDVRDGSVTFEIRFAAGTFDPSTTRVTIELDTDRLESTGMHTIYGLGIDYAVDLWAPTRQALVLEAVPSGACTAASPCYTRTTASALTLLPDGMKATFPLAVLGHSDGRLRFRVLAYAMTPGSTLQSPTKTADFMPDATLPPGRVGEPGPRS